MKSVFLNRVTLGAAIAGLGLAAMAQAQVPYAGVTTLVMGLDVSNGIIPPAPGSRVCVPPNERVTFLVPDSWTYPIKWSKDGKAIAGATGRTLVIPLAATADSGRYTITGAPFPQTATGISLEVVPAGHLGNFSSRLELSPGAGVQITGFVVSGSTPKNLLIRAVGPSLKAFGLPKPVSQPRLRFFDSTGKEIGFTHAAVVVDLEAFFSAVGAFPLTGGETSFEYGEFKPGAYTIQVSDATGQGGTLLVEAYEFTTGPAPLVVPIR